MYICDLKRWILSWIVKDHREATIGQQDHSCQNMVVLITMRFQNPTSAMYMPHSQPPLPWLSVLQMTAWNKNTQRVVFDFNVRYHSHVEWQFVLSCGFDINTMLTIQSFCCHRVSALSVLVVIYSIYTSGQDNNFHVYINVRHVYLHWYVCGCTCLAKQLFPDNCRCVHLYSAGPSELPHNDPYNHRMSINIIIIQLIQTGKKGSDPPAFSFSLQLRIHFTVQLQCLLGVWNHARLDRRYCFPGASHYPDGCQQS